MRATRLRCNTGRRGEALRFGVSRPQLSPDGTCSVKAARATEMHGTQGDRRAQTSVHNARNTVSSTRSVHRYDRLPLRDVHSDTQCARHKHTSLMLCLWCQALVSSAQPARAPYPCELQAVHGCATPRDRCHRNAAIAVCDITPARLTVAPCIVRHMCAVHP